MVSNPLQTETDLNKQEVELTEFGERNGILLLDDNHNIDTANIEHESLLSNTKNPLDSSTTDHGDSLRIYTTHISFDDKIKILQHSRQLLYLSHLLAQFSEVSWQFCLTIFLAALTNYQSLFLVSTYGLVTGLAVTLLGSTTGSLVDTTNRLVAARCFIWMENLSVIMATLCCFWLLSNKKNQHTASMLSKETAPTTETNQQSFSILMSVETPTDMPSILLIIAIHLLGAAARVLDEGFLVAMERDWVVVMSRFVTTNNDSIPDNDISLSKQQTATLTTTKNFSSRSWLSETNVAMKQIDLSCKVLAPAVAGFCIALVDNRPSSSSETIHQEHDYIMSNGSQFQYAALAVGAINVFSLIVEYYCTTVIYQSIPDLALLKQSTEHGNDKDQAEEDQDKNSSQGEPIAPVTAPLTGSNWRAFLPYGSRVYLEQKTCLAGIGLAMLYLNALTFDAIFTAYLVWRGMGLETIGIWRGVSSAIGLLGTCVYHWSVKRMTLELTGMWSIVYEFLCLSLSYGSLYVDDSHVSLVMLITGVCASRIGLWVFDITVTQMMQEYVPDGIRGVVGGVQQSSNAFFNLLSYALGILFPDPGHFYIYVAAGYASVGIAMLLYGWGTYGYCIKEMQK